MSSVLVNDIINPVTQAQGPWHYPWSSVSHSKFSPLTTCTRNLQNTQPQIYSHRAIRYNCRTSEWEFWISWSQLCAFHLPLLLAATSLLITKETKKFPLQILKSAVEFFVCCSLQDCLLVLLISFTLLLLIFLLLPWSHYVSLPSLSCGFPLGSHSFSNSSQLHQPTLISYVLAFPVLIAVLYYPDNIWRKSCDIL